MKFIPIIGKFFIYFSIEIRRKKSTHKLRYQFMGGGTLKTTIGNWGGQWK